MHSFEVHDKRLSLFLFMATRNPIRVRLEVRDRFFKCWQFSKLNSGHIRTLICSYSINIYFMKVTSKEWWEISSWWRLIILVGQWDFTMILILVAPQGRYLLNNLSWNIFDIIFHWSSQVDMPIKHLILQDLCTLACNNNLLDLCNVHELPGTPAFDASNVFPPSWRFFPILDPQVICLYNRIVIALELSRKYCEAL